MKRLEVKCWCIWLATLLILLFASSCKSRDTNKSRSSDQIEVGTQSDQSNQVIDKSQEKSKSDQELQSEIKAKEEVKKTAYKLTPVDKDKPIIIKDPDGKETSISNAIVESEDSSTKRETEEKTRETTSTEASKHNDVASKSQSSSKGRFKAKSEALRKETDSEPILSFWWLIPLIIIAVIARFIYKKIKNNGWRSVFNFK